MTQTRRRHGHRVRLCCDRLCTAVLTTPSPQRAGAAQSATTQILEQRSRHAAQEGAYVILTLRRLQNWCSGEELVCKDAQSPRVQCSLSDNCLLAVSERLNHFRRSIQDAEAHARGAADASCAAKVNDCPPVLPWQPHHVAGLQVTVRIACFVQACQTGCNVLDHLQALQHK